MSGWLNDKFLVSYTGIIRIRFNGKTISSRIGSSQPGLSKLPALTSDSYANHIKASVNYCQ